jgi:hypothetical protein
MRLSYAIQCGLVGPVHSQMFLFGLCVAQSDCIHQAHMRLLALSEHNAAAKKQEGVAKIEGGVAKT